MPRAFGTDTLNSANPLTKPAPLMAVPAAAPSGLASMSRRTGRRSGLSNRLLAVDESKARDRSWLYEADSNTTPSPTDSSESRPRFAGAPICNNFVRDGYCAYGDSCGFDHPAPQPTVPARRISVPVIPTVRRSSDAFLVGPAAPAPSTTRSGSGVGRGRDLSPAPIGFAQARRERSMGRVHDISRSRDARRPSLVATQSAPAVVPAHPDAPPAVPVLAPMFYATYRRGSNGEVLDPSLIPHAVQAQKSLYYRTKPCRYWSADGNCPKGDKCTFIHDPALAGVGGSKPEFEGIKTAPASPREASPVRVSQEQVVEEEAPKATKAQRPSRLPLVSPTKAREPHPAWRVVGGGVTLAAAAAAATEDQMDEDAVEQALLADEQKPFTSPVQAAPAPSYGFPSPSPSGSRSSFSSPVTPQPVPVVPQAHNGFPAYALPTHPVFHAYAYPGPVPYSEPQPQPVFVQQPAYGVPPGWSLVMVPPPSAQPRPQQQQQPQHIAYYPAPSPAPCATAPAPVLYGATETSYTYGYPQSGETIHALAGAGVDVSALDGSERPFVLDSNLGDAYDDYGIVAHPEDDEDDIEVSVGSMPMISTAAAAPCAAAKPWGFARKLSSWADEVEAADPDLSGVHSNGDEMMQVDNSWPQCSTTPNSPRANRRLFQAEA